MNIVILAGGFGTRISEYTKSIPKPMIKIKGKPIIEHIINHYKSFGYKKFFIAGGYKYKIIENYFKKKKEKNIDIKIINTGLNTMTGGRLKKLQKFLNKKTFMLTYGDGLSDINLRKLLSFHKNKKGIATLTAVRPPARFGVIKINEKNRVTLFREKSSLDEGWINGGFFVFEPEIFKYLKNDQTFLEKSPLIKLSSINKLFAYKHKNFWQCVDTVRDKEILEKKFKKKIEKKN